MYSRVCLGFGGGIDELLRLLKLVRVLWLGAGWCGS